MITLKTFSVVQTKVLTRVRRFFALDALEGTIDAGNESHPKLNTVGDRSKVPVNKDFPKVKNQNEVEKNGSYD